MCYSAMVEHDFRKMFREMPPPHVDYAAFADIYERRLENDAIKLPKALDANFYHPKTPDEKRIFDLIQTYNKARTKVLETELFKQKARLGDAERKLKVKETKAALDSQRIASNKIQWHLDKIADIKRTEPKARDSRIFPMHYAPVIIRRDGENIILPMRYHCRPAGKPAFYDQKYDGLYNARRDNLEGFWKDQFGHSHAIALVTGFYENVAKHDFEHRELAPDEKPQNLILNFNPQPPVQMLVACLYSHWQEAGKDDLYSFAAITDEPPPEVSAAGHDRCIVPIKQENVNAWLEPEKTGKEALYDILDDRERPYYEHRLAA
ncbi:MAG: SOS response-associated peptidase family protein [Stenotrophobium sp.]